MNVEFHETEGINDRILGHTEVISSYFQVCIYNNRAKSVWPLL